MNSFSVFSFKDRMFLFDLGQLGSHCSQHYPVTLLVSLSCWDFTWPQRKICILNVIFIFSKPLISTLIQKFSYL